AVEIAIIITIVFAGFGSAVLHLWNWLMPSLFGLRVITYWEAVGVMGLSWILFGGLRGFGLYRVVMGCLPNNENRCGEQWRLGPRRDYPACGIGGDERLCTALEEFGVKTPPGVSAFSQF